MGEKGEKFLVKKNHEVGDSNANSSTMCYSSHPSQSHASFLG